MARTLVALFDNPTEAERVSQDLTREGMKREDVTLLGTEGERGGKGAPFGEIGEARERAVAGGIEGALERLGMSELEARSHAERVRAGGSIIALTLEEAQFDRAMDVLKQHNAADIRQLGLQAKRAGVETADRGPIAGETFRTAEAAPVGERLTMERGEGRARHEEEVRIPVIEEEVHVGKREVEAGGVRVESHVEETPFAQDIRLREEHVHVEREHVDRPVSAMGPEAFRERVIEVHEMAEQPVIAKEAREVEEVVVSKDVREHTEHVQDTLRHTVVNVEALGPEHRGAPRMEPGTAASISETTASAAAPASTTARIEPSAFQGAFRRDYDANYAKTGLGYDYYQPAYTYGVILATDTRYTGRNWTDVEPEAYRAWEDRNPKTWDDYKNAIRFGWDQARGRR